jgi:hypothetical protein
VCAHKRFNICQKKNISFFSIFFVNKKIIMKLDGWFDGERDECEPSYVDDAINISIVKGY